MRLPHRQNTEGIDYAVVGVPWDGATSYRTGQRLAPDAIRRASMTIRPYNLAMDVGIFELSSGVDYGDISVDKIFFFSASHYPLSIKSKSPFTATPFYPTYPEISFNPASKIDRPFSSCSSVITNGVKTRTTFP